MAGTPASLEPSGLERALHRHALDPWFPRCLDREHGGFLCDFDARWRPRGAHVKMLEFQARQTRVAALGCRLHPEDPAWREACVQGYEGLRTGLWDAELGGWYACTDRAWAPLDNGEKHAHGTAYAILACLDVARTLGDDAALQRAREGFDWLDAHAWDRSHGGYWGWMRRDGRVYADEPDSAPRPRDHMGLAAGRKSVNVAGDMVETLTEAHHRDPRDLTAERLATLVEHFDGWFAEHGHLPVAYHADLSAASSVAHGGYPVQASWRLPLARAVLGGDLTVGPVERGYRSAGSAVRGRTGFVADGKVREEWWMQFELLRSLVLQAAIHPDEAPALLREAAAHLERVQRAYLDKRHGGVSQLPRRALRPSHKGDRWKDGSHEAMAFSACARLLGRPDGAPPLGIDEALTP